MAQSSSSQRRSPQLALTCNRLQPLPRPNGRKLRGSDPQYVSSGHLVFAREGTLFAVPFDPQTHELGGSERPVQDGIEWEAGTGRHYFSVSRNGTLLYPRQENPSRERQLVWVDRVGTEKPVTEHVRSYVFGPSLSPDERRVAVAVGESSAEIEIWILDIARDVLTRLTHEGGFNARPLWSPDSARIYYASNLPGTFSMFSRPSDGSGTSEQLAFDAYRVPTSISSDGETLIFRRDGGDDLNRDIGMMSLRGNGAPVTLLASRFSEHSEVVVS